MDAATFDFAASIDIDDEGVAMAVDEAEDIVAARGEDSVGDGNVGVGNVGVGGGGGRGLPRNPGTVRCCFPTWTYYITSRKSLARGNVEVGGDISDDDERGDGDGDGRGVGM